jgi:hypothetical protein
VINTAVHAPQGTVVAGRAVVVLAFVSVVSFVAFVVVLVAAGLREPGYSAVSDAIGGLGARNAVDPDLMNAGYVALGVAAVAAGIALLRLLPRKSGTAASVIVIVSGLGAASLATVHQDCSTSSARCVTAGLATDLSIAHTVHRALAVGLALALVASLWLMLVSLSGTVGMETLARLTSWAAIASTVVFIWYGSELYGDIGGAIERLLTLMVFGWPVFLAVVLTRPRPA